MITALGLATVWVLDQDRALDFYTGKLGLEVREDVTLGEGGMRWVTVGAKDQPDLKIALMVPGPPSMDPASAERFRGLLAKGVLGAGAFTTDDCQATYEELVAKGVTFVQKPERRPYGIEAILRDDSGNWFSLTQRFETLDETAPWAGCAE